MSVNRALLFCLCICLLIGCAKKVAPDGGPQDLIPASVVSTEPATGSTNVSATTIRFTFDDYVDRSVRDAFSVMPTVRFSAGYAGDKVDVEFKEPLLPNTTYVVTLGTGYQDIRGNKPLQAVSVVFSTGQDIDTGSISGEIDYSSPATLIIFAYPRSESLDSSFSPAETQPPYRLPVGTSGRFTLNGLADGTYRVMAVRDENKNGLIEASEDFAMAPQDVVVSNGTSRPLILRVGSAIDLTPPEATSARALSHSLVQVSFAERVRIAPSAGAPFTITDSSGRSLGVSAWYQWRVPDDKVLLRLRDTLVAGTYNVSVAPGAVVDSAGLLIADTARRLSFRGNNIRDTSTLRVLSVSPKDSTQLAPDSAIAIVFSEAVDTVGFDRSGILQADSAIKSASWDGPTRLLVRAPYLSRTAYNRVSIKLVNVRSSIGASLIDTTIVRTLKATERVDPGAVQGVVIDSADFGSPMLLRVLSARGGVVKTAYVTSGVLFTLDSIRAGEVRFDVVKDVNMNGRYDHGEARRYKPSEDFYVFPTQVVVRARWTIEDVRLVIRR